MGTNSSTGLPPKNCNDGQFDSGGWWRREAPVGRRTRVHPCPARATVGRRRRWGRAVGSARDAGLLDPDRPRPRWPPASTGWRWRPAIAGWSTSAKPAVVAALVVAAAVIPVDRTDLVDRRWWFVAALVFCLAGDVLLMLPRDLFVPGLAAFLVGHVLFIVGPPAAAGAGRGAPFSFSTTGLVRGRPGRGGGRRPYPGTLLVRSLLVDGPAGPRPSGVRLRRPPSSPWWCWP